MLDIQHSLVISNLLVSYKSILIFNVGYFQVNNCNEGPALDKAFGQGKGNPLNLLPSTPALRLQPCQMNLREPEQYLQPELRLG